MSLINDALKRARHQALEQEADGSAVSYRAVPAHSRRPRRAWAPYVIGGGVVALVILGLSLLWRSDGPDEKRTNVSSPIAPAASPDSLPEAPAASAADRVSFAASRVSLAAKSTAIARSGQSEVST